MYAKCKRIVSLFAICASLMVSLFIFPLNVVATEDTTATTSTTSSSTTTTTSTTSTTTTTTVAAPKGVEITQVFCYGSNNKLYNKLIKYTALSEQYSATVSIPLWMESLQINIKSVKGATITCDGKEFSANGNVYSHTIEFDAATKYTQKTYTITIKKDNEQSVLTFNLAQTVFATTLESIEVDSKDAEGSNEAGYKYILPEGTTSCRIKIRTRSEETVTMGKAGEEAETLELTPDKVYNEKVSLSEGENVFNIKVSAPGTTISTTLTIYVGEPVVSSEIVSSEPSAEIITSETDMPDDEDDVPAPIIPSSEPEVSSIVKNENNGNTTSPLIWILIGVVIAVVIGACIFMIASMGGSGNGNRQGGSRHYGGQYRASMPPPPAPARRRDLGRFVDDDYYDQGEPQYNDDRYYQNDNYDDGYYDDGTFYDDYNRSAPVEPYPERYERQPQRQQYQSQRRGNRSEFDDYYDDYYN